MRFVFWLGWGCSLTLLLLCFPRLNSDGQNFIPVYTAQLQNIRTLGSRVTPNDFWPPPDRSSIFLAFSILNLPVWWLHDQDYRNEWVRHGSTGRTILQDLAEERAFRFPHIFRTYWYSDARFITTSAIASAFWWLLLASVARTLLNRRGAVA
jgi:hypothetical protein